MLFIVDLVKYHRFHDLKKNLLNTKKNYFPILLFNDLHINCNARKERRRERESAGRAPGQVEKANISQDVTLLAKRQLLSVKSLLYL